MNSKNLPGATAVFLLLAHGAPANATVIDFDTVDSFTVDGRIDRIGDVTFSRDLYTFPDGFELFDDGGNNLAYDFYAESEEYLSFDRRPPIFSSAWT